MQILKDEIRNAILEEAMRLFLRHGYSNCTMRMIAIEVKISVSLIYKYYANKEKLYEVLVKDVYERFLSSSESFLAEENDGNYTEENIRYVSKRFATILNNIRPQFLLLMSNPEAPLCNDLPKMLKEKLTMHIMEGTDTSAGFEPFMVGLLAGQLWDGIVEVVQETSGEEQMESRFRQLIRYHFAGLSLFHDRP